MNDWDLICLTRRRIAKREMCHVIAMSSYPSHQVSVGSETNSVGKDLTEWCQHKLKVKLGVPGVKVLVAGGNGQRPIVGGDKIQ
ncbi:hypothetical protein Hdeb2414_s0754g00943561 [Helianthus debilis subsp. tardiflorus]